MTNDEIINSVHNGLNQLADIGEHARTVHGADCVDKALVMWSAIFVQFVSDATDIPLDEMVFGIAALAFDGDVTIDPQTFPMNDPSDPRDIGA